MGGSYIWIVLQINPRHSKHLPIVRHCALHKDATASRTGTNFQTAVALINFDLNRSIPRQSRLHPQCCAGIRTPQSAARPNRRRAPCLRPNSRRSLRVKVSSSTKPCWHKNSTASRIGSNFQTAVSPRAFGLNHGVQSASKSSSSTMPRPARRVRRSAVRRASVDSPQL